MRNELIDFLVSKKHERDFEKLVFITGDLGFSVIEPLEELLGNRFINAGVAEALMASLAAGLASEGYKVVIYSIVPFTTFRCLEQIRNDICYHNLDVTIAGIGAGFGYGTLGPTHHSTEDLAAIAALPNMTVFNPGDLLEAEWAFEAAWKLTGPKYLRLSKGGDKKLHLPANNKNQPCEAWDVSNGSELTVISTGTILPEIFQAITNHPELIDRIQLISIPQMKPFPAGAVARLVRAKNSIILSELNPYGGLAGHASLALQNVSKIVATREAGDSFASTPGSCESIRRTHGLDSHSIYQLIASTLAEHAG